MSEHTKIPVPHTITCHVMQREWSVTFTDTDFRTRIGPWLLCDSHDDVLRVLNWRHISALELDEHHRNIGRWGVGGGTLHLTSRERHQLIARGHGWPRNGLELGKMKAAGLYPPERLSPSQKAAYLRRYRQH